MNDYINLALILVTILLLLIVPLPDNVNLSEVILMYLIISGSPAYLVLQSLIKYLNIRQLQLRKMLR
jgi:hypothetical protein